MRKTVAYAFHHSIPILIGFFPVGLAYGLLMQQAGYNFLLSLIHISEPTRRS